MSSPATCVICGDLQTEEALLIRAPCGRHHVCSDDLEQYFRQATKDESQYPPSCCDAPFMLTDYDEHLPFEISWEYQIKEHGEYSIQKKFRIYCANPSCAKFLRPDSHITDSEHQVTYAICEDETCGKVSCVICKTVLVNGVAGHVCKVSEADKLFKDTAKKEGYQECYACGSTVELAEACNHMSCECGNDFCYICGKPWPGVHGCPHYGPAIYDEEGYNQEGYHRDTELNREGLTRRQQQRQDAGDEDDDEEEGEEEEDEVDGFPPWATDEFREFLRQLPRDLWEDAIDQEETQRIERGEFFVPAPPPVDPGDDGEDAVGEGENDEEEDEDVGVPAVEDMDILNVSHEPEDAAIAVGQNEDQDDTFNKAPEDNVINSIVLQQPSDLDEIEDFPALFMAIDKQPPDNTPSNDNQEPSIGSIRTTDMQPSTSHTNPQTLNADGSVILNTYTIYGPPDLSTIPPGSPEPLWHVVSTPNAKITGYNYTPPQSAQAHPDFSYSSETPGAEFSGSESSNSLPAPRDISKEMEVETEDREDSMQIDGVNAEPLTVRNLPYGSAITNEELNMHEAGRSMPGAW